MYRQLNLGDIGSVMNASALEEDMMMNKEPIPRSPQKAQDSQVSHFIGVLNKE